MTVMHLIGLRRNKRTGIWEYRRTIPRRLRPYHSSGEFKRSTGTTKKAEAERLTLPFIAQFNALVAGLMVALERAAQAQPPASSLAGPKDESGPVAPVTPDELRTMAGEIARSLIDQARKDHLANPTSREPFRLNSAIPPAAPGDRSAPWGTRADLWAGHRFMLLAPKSYGVPASAQRIVTDAALATAQERFGAARFGDRTANLCGPAWETLCEFTRDAMDGAYAVLQGRHRGTVEWTPESFAESFPEASPAAPESGVKITGLAEHWKAGKERTDQKTFDRYSRALVEFAAFLGHDDPARVQRGDFQRWLVSLSETKKLAAKTINEGYRAG